MKLLMTEDSDTAPNLKVRINSQSLNMYIVKLIKNSAIKYCKGMLLLSAPLLLTSTCLFIFESCKKNSFDKSETGVAAKHFIDALNANRNQIGAIILNSKNQSTLTINNKNQSTSALNRTSIEEGTLNLDFPTGTDPEIINRFNSSANIQNISDALNNYNAAIQDTANVETEIILQLPVAQITASLQPLVVEAKNYLIAKGFTTQTIQDMIQEEGVTELELIPFVKALTSIEQNQYSVSSINIPFTNSANALPHFVQCGLAALGADALYSLSLSSATVWTYAAMRTAFTAVAKRFLGPIGVAVAVVSFGICMLS